MENTNISSVSRVKSALSDLNIAAEVLELPQTTRTAADAAAALGCQVAQIAKSIVFEASPSGRAVLVLARGDRKVNEDTLSQALSEQVKKASADFVREKTGFAIGGVCPYGLASNVAIFFDSDLMAFEHVWIAAGSPNSVCKLMPGQLLETTAASSIQF